MLDRQTIPEFFHIPEQECLVVRPFNKQLKLGVLVRYTQCGRWRLAVVDVAASPVQLFAQAFSPELFEPEREFPQRLRVWEQNQDLFAAFSLENKFNKSCN